MASEIDRREAAGAPAGTASPAAAPQDDAEATAWAAVLAAWEDDAAHRAYLARYGDLDGLTRAGRRYREVLARRPGDPVAVRFRDEIVKRATVQGLAQLPRSAPPRQVPRWAKRAIVAVLSSVVAGAIWKIFEIMGGGGSAP